MNAEKSKPIALVIASVSGILSIVTIGSFAVYQISQVLKRQVTLPNISNINQWELILISLLLALIILGRIFLNFNSVKSRDAKQPSRYFLQTRKKLRILAFLLLLMAFVTP
ncbi:MAG: hypothetical protein ABJN22_14655 [Litorimonas sp.]